MKWTGQLRTPAAKKPMHTEPFALRQCRGLTTGKSRNWLAASNRGIDYVDQPAGLTGTGQTGENMERHPSQCAVVCPQCNVVWVSFRTLSFRNQSFPLPADIIDTRVAQNQPQFPANQSAFAADGASRNYCDMRGLRRIQKLPPPQECKLGKVVLRSSSWEWLR
jgi:hypothetical protein